jgi:hypothetical protein
VDPGSGSTGKGEVKVDKDHSRMRIPKGTRAIRFYGLALWRLFREGNEKLFSVCSEFSSPDLVVHQAHHFKAMIS